MPTKELKHELLTVREAADELGVSVPTVHRMVHRGIFRTYWPSPRRLWLYADSVRGHKIASTSEPKVA